MRFLFLNAPIGFRLAYQLWHLAQAHRTEDISTKNQRPLKDRHCYGHDVSPLSYAFGRPKRFKAIQVLAALKRLQPILLMKGQNAQGSDWCPMPGRKVIPKNNPSQAIGLSFKALTENINLNGTI